MCRGGTKIQKKSVDNLSDACINRVRGHRTNRSLERAKMLPQRSRFVGKPQRVEVLRYDFRGGLVIEDRIIREDVRWPQSGQPPDCTGNWRRKC